MFIVATIISDVVAVFIPSIIFFINSFSKPIYFKKILNIKICGVTTPNVATIAPNILPLIIPIKVEAFIAIGPGVICDIATISINVRVFIQA